MRVPATHDATRSDTKYHLMRVMTQLLKVVTVLTKEPC